MNPQRIAQLRALIPQDSTDPFLPYALGQEYVSGEAWADAAAQFEACARDFPDYLPTYYHWGRVLIQVDEIQQAQMVLERGLVLARQQKDGKTALEIEALLEDLE